MVGGGPRDAETSAEVDAGATGAAMVGGGPNGAMALLLGAEPVGMTVYIDAVGAGEVGGGPKGAVDAGREPAEDGSAAGGGAVPSLMSDNSVDTSPIGNGTCGGDRDCCVTKITLGTGSTSLHILEETAVANGRGLSFQILLA